MYTFFALDLIIYSYLGIASSNGCTDYDPWSIMVLDFVELILVLVYFAVQAENYNSDFKQLAEAVRSVPNVKSKTMLVAISTGLNWF